MTRTESRKMGIITACKTGNLAWLKEQKAAGTLGDVTAVNNHAVRAAAANGHLEVIKWLILDSGQKIDITGSVDFLMCNFPVLLNRIEPRSD